MEQYNIDNLDGEIWKDLECLEGVYQVSNMGRFRRSKTKRLIKPYKKKCGGYYGVKTYINGKVKNHKIHRLVAMAFIENPLNKSQVNHIDGDKSNNQVSNLEWTTCLENLYHAALNGLRKSKLHCYYPDVPYLPLDVEPPFPIYESK